MSTNDRPQPIDDRATAAAADLRQRADARPVPAFDVERLAQLADAPAPAARRVGRTAPKLLAAAAAVVLLAAAVWAFSARGDGSSDDEPAGVTSTSQPPLLPSQLPDGTWQIAGAADITEEDLGPSPTSSLVLYGPSADDPQLALMEVQDLDPAELDAQPRSTIEVDDTSVDIYVGTLIGRRTATVVRGDRTLLAISADLDDGALAELAAAAVPGSPPSLLDDALPDGWQRLGEEPDGLYVAMPYAVMRGAATSPARLAVYVAEPDRFISIAVGPAADPTATLRARVLRTVASDADGVDVVEVGEQEAVAGTISLGDGQVDPIQMITWVSDAGALVRVTGTGVDREELLAVARTLDPVTDAEWEQLVEDSQLGRLPGSMGGGEGVTGPPESSLASGEFDDGTAWDLKVRADGGVQLDVALDAPGGTSGSGMTTSVGSDATIVSTTITETGGRRFMAGLLRADITRVEHRTPDGAVFAAFDTVPLPPGHPVHPEIVGDGLVWFVLELPSGDGALHLFAEGDAEAFEVYPMTGGGIDAEPSSTTVPD